MSMPNNEREDRLVVLTDKINNLSPSLSECCISRVHNQLRDVNKMAYDPVLVSIGPYHRGNERLRTMEEYKLRYLRNVTHQNPDTLEKYFSAMKSLEEKARKYYAEPIGLDKDEFTEMLLLDSCFVVESIREIHGLGEEDPLISNIDWMVSSLQRDLMLFENQLPFFVILKMLDLIEDLPDNHHTFISLALRFFSDLIIENSSLHSPNPQPPENWEIGGIKHLLGMLHDIWLTSKLGEASNQESQESNVGGRFIPSASKLREAGVKFKKAEGGVLFDISFKNGVIRIPQLIIVDMTECFIRNLIAYEQHMRPSSGMFVTKYVALLDNLINTPKDVELLCDSGILENWVGDEEVISNIFNKIGDSVMLPADYYNYAHLCKQVNDFYRSKINRWMAKLKRNHLNSPWAVISIVAAIILLLFTATQTVIAALSI